MPGGSSSVVVNTGPLLALGACGQIELLQALHTQVVVPQPVLEELERGQGRQDRMGAALLCPPWMQVLPARQPPSQLLQAHLDEGEASVIALALELGIRLVLMDERRGRVVARTMGLAVTGTVGVLVRAKREGFLPLLKPCLEAMHEKGVWLSARLTAFALNEAGES